MINYKKSSCQFCGKKFDSSDNIVVCPECGAPYHKECVAKSGKCVYADKHERGFKFEDPEAEKAESRASGCVCPICGFENSPEAIYCSRCGGNMNRRSGTGASNHGQNMYGDFRSPDFGAGFAANAQPVDPNEEISGVRAGDIAKYVGENSAYFLPRFQDIENKTRRYSKFNLAALIFEYWYFLYRKMWGAAAFAFVITFILSIPSTFLSLSSAGFINLNVDSNLLLMINSVSYIITILFRAFLSYYSNRIYMRKVIKNVKKYKNESIPSSEYDRVIAKRGSTSKTAVIICAAVYFIVMVFATTVLAMYA